MLLHTYIIGWCILIHIAISMYSLINSSRLRSNSLIIYVYHLCVQMHMNAGSSGGQKRGLGSLELPSMDTCTRAYEHRLGSCELPVWGLEIQLWSSARVARFLAAGPASVFNRFSRKHWIFCVLWIIFCKVWHIWQCSYSCTFLLLFLTYYTGQSPLDEAELMRLEVSDIYFPSFISKREISMLTITFDKWKPFLEDTAFWRINALVQ